MIRNSDKFIILFAVAVLVTLTVGIVSAAPETQNITYQGKLMDAAGNPLTGTYSVTFRLYSVSIGGTALVTDTHTVQVSKGLFTTQITFDAGYFIGDARWVGITVGSDAEMTPRQEIRPVPYALSLRPGAIVKGSSSNYAMYIVSNDTSYSTGLKIDTLGFASRGIVASSSGDNSDAMYAETTGASSATVYAVARGPNSNAVSVETHGDSNSGVWSDIYGDNSNGFATATHGSNSQGVNVVTTGTNSKGVFAQTSGDNSNALFGSTSGLSSYGVYGIASGNDNCGVAGGTTGSGSPGVFGTTTGPNSPGVRASTHGYKSPGVDVTTKNDYSRGVNVSTAGANSDGMYASTAGWASKGVNVSTTNQWSHGMYASTAGSNSHGVVASTAGWASEGVHVSTTNQWSHGVYASTEGVNSDGMYASTTNAGSIGMRAYTSGPGSDGVHVSTWGPNSLGVYASTSGPGSPAIYGNSAQDIGVYGKGRAGGYFTTYMGGSDWWTDRRPAVNISTIYNVNPGITVDTLGYGSPGAYSTTHGDNSQGFATTTSGSGSPGFNAYTAGLNSNGVDATSAQSYGLYGHTGRSDQKYGIYTPDYLYAKGTQVPAADVAEYMPVTENATPGTVLIISEDGKLQPSTTAYDTKVAGIVSTDPGVTLGTKENGNPGEQIIAVAGRVPCKVDATQVPIHAGDLLTTSDNPGYAMKAEQVSTGTLRFYLPGTTLGKAMGSLESGTGTIEVLVTLQ